MSRLLQVAAIALTLLGHGTVRSEDEDPAARWLTVYGWIQTGERLAGADQWSLALGSYLEANRLLADLAGAHPAFEPEMVSYRREALADSIAAIESRLTEDDHVTMMKYLDFIESLELGEKQRYDNEFEAALGTLGMAKALLDEISSGKPEGFREAVASQYERLRSGIEWLDSQVNFKARSRPAVLADDPVDWGTTRFVKESDLPGDPASGSVSPELFPPSLALAIRDESGPAAEPAPPRRRPFAPARSPPLPHDQPRIPGTGKPAGRAVRAVGTAPGAVISVKKGFVGAEILCIASLDLTAPATSHERHRPRSRTLPPSLHRFPGRMAMGQGRLRRRQVRSRAARHQSQLLL